MVVRNLVLSSKASPFPYAAVAIAMYTQKAEVNYEEDAVRALAKAGGLAEDSVKIPWLRSPAVPQIMAPLDSLDDYLAY
ncbi:hypothetical protein V8E53_002635 [Lactarius tabidus]